jgi:Tol biopolymer transport system component
MRGTRLVLAGIATVATSSLWTGEAAAGTFPGSNGLIAFTGVPSGSDTEILTIRPDGQGLAQVTNNSEFDGDPSWSSDGERIAFIQYDGDNEIFVMNADGSNQARLTNNSLGDQNPSFSPDGNTIVFEHDDGNDTEIYAMNDDGTNQVPLTDNAVDDAAPTVSPNGQAIAFERDAPDSEIFVMGAGGQNPTPLTDNAIGDFTPNFSPNGERLLVTSSDGGDQGVFVINADGSNRVPLTNNGLTDGDGFFSPDGQGIVFVRFVSPSFDLYTMEATGASQAPLTTGPSSDEEPDWQALNPPSCDLTGPPKQKAFNQVSVTITCANEDATVDASGQGKAPKVPTLAVSASKAKRFSIPAVTANVPTGTPTTIELPIPKKGRKALKRAAKAGKKGKATISITATDDLGESVQDSLKVKFKKKKK